MTNHGFEVIGRCGSAEFFEAATVLRTHYPADDSTALIANPGTPDQQTYTVCLYADPAPIKPGHVWLKGWSENEGVPEALQDAGLVKLTGKTWKAGYELAQEAQLLGPEWD